MKLSFLTVILVPLCAESAAAQCPADDMIAGSSCATATAISTSQNISGLRAVSGTSDWFRFDVPPGSSLRVTANFDAASGNLDLYLDRDGCQDEFVSFSAGSGDSEKVEVSNAGSTTAVFQLEVVLYPGSCVDYALDVRYLDPSPCLAQDDVLEENDDAASAEVLTLPVFEAGLRVGSGDEDWYRFTQTAGTDLALRADFQHALGDIDLVLFDDASNELARSDGYTDGEEILWLDPSATARTRLLRVTRKGIGCSDYDLELSERPTEDPCFAFAADAFEPNDTCLSAEVLPAGLTTGLNAGVEGLAGDWYLLSVPAGMQAEVEARFSHAAGDIDLESFSTCGGVLLDSSRSLSDDESVVVANLSTSPLDFLLHAYVWTGSLEPCNGYDLDVEFSPAMNPCALLQDDALEENDSCDSALTLAAGFYPGLLARMRGDDTDWYEVEVPASSRLVFDVFHRQAEGNIELAAYRDCAAGPLAEAISTDDDERLEVSNDTAAPQTIRVEVYVNATSFSTCTPYEVEVWTVPSNPCPPVLDAYEPNNLCGAAVSVPLGFLSGLTCRKNSDRDYYLIEVPPGATLTADAFFLQSVADMDLELFGGCGNFLQQAITETDNERIVRTNGTGVTQTYILHAFVWSGSSGTCNVYDLNLDVRGGDLTPFCFGDGEGVSCPCRNDSPAGHPGGCAHQDGRGAQLVASGVPGVGGDTLHFDLTRGSRGSFGVLVSGDNQLGLQAFDGLRCAGGNLRRHGTRAITIDGVAVGGWGGSAAPVGGLIASSGFAAGQTRHFFAFFRTDDQRTCGSGQNSTNAVTVLIGP